MDPNDALPDDPHAQLVRTGTAAGRERMRDY